MRLTTFMLNYGRRNLIAGCANSSKLGVLKIHEASLYNESALVRSPHIRPNILNKSCAGSGLCAMEHNLPQRSVARHDNHIAGKVTLLDQALPIISQNTLHKRNGRNQQPEAIYYLWLVQLRVRATTYLKT